MKSIMFILWGVCGILSSCDLFFADVSGFLDSSQFDKENVQNAAFEYELSSDESFYSVSG